MFYLKDQMKLLFLYQHIFAARDIFMIISKCTQEVRNQLGSSVYNERLGQVYYLLCYFGIRHIHKTDLPTFMVLFRNALTVLLKAFFFFYKSNDIAISSQLFSQIKPKTFTLDQEILLIRVQRIVANYRELGGFLHKY